MNHTLVRVWLTTLLVLAFGAVGSLIGGMILYPNLAPEDALSNPFALTMMWSTVALVVTFVIGAIVAIWRTK